MPKRDRSIPSSPRALGSPTRALGSLVRWGSNMAFSKSQSLTVDISAPPEQTTSRPTTPLTKAMRTRRMSQLAHIEDISTAFARQASIMDRALEEVRSLPKPRSGPNPTRLPAPHIVGPSPRCKHVASVIVLHGFTCDGEMLAGELLPPLQSRLKAKQFGGIRFVFLTAPLRAVSCYGTKEEHAWHDYFTDHGGAEGRPEIEETVDVGQLEWSAAQVHAAMDAEAKLLGGDYARIGVVGQSQGSCTAPHSVLTHPENACGVFCSIGQLYSVTPVKPEKRGLQVYTFNGAADDCIACCLSLRTYSQLLEAGFRHVRMHVEPHAGHEGSTDAEVALLCEALESWGLLKAPCA